MIHGLLTLLLMLVFVAIVIWAWSGKRQPTYESAARQPLQDSDCSVTVSAPTADRRSGVQEVL